MNQERRDLLSKGFVAEHMKLEINEYKGLWDRERPWEYLRLLLREVVELIEAPAKEKWLEAADVSIYAKIFADCFDPPTTSHDYVHRCVQRRMDRMMTEGAPL